MLTCVAETRVVAEPVVAEPVPAEDHLVTILAEIRDIEVAVAVPHNSLPCEDCFALEVFPEEDDALLLDFLEVAQSAVVLEVAGVLEVGVDLVSFNPLPIFLAVVEPHLRLGDVVFSRTSVFQLRMHDRLHPIGV